MSLKTYHEKRRFDRTPEPSGARPVLASGRSFVIQKHAASRLHYDFRLEWGGVLKSWAVPKGPSLDPEAKSLAVHVEDHPLEYASFEGIIPAGEYGGGTVMVWDRGSWEPEDDPEKSFRKGKLKFRLYGDKLQGQWTLVRMRGTAGDDGKNWLLIKSDDDAARSTDEYDVLEAESRSILSGRTLDEIADDADDVWSSGEDGETTAAGGSVLDPSALDGARRRKLPRSFQPQLATAVKQTPAGDEWLHELKFDGYRLLCRCEDDGVQLLTRRGNDWTDRFPTVARAIEKLGCSGTIIDGEVVVLSKDGTTDFQALQNLMHRGRDDDVVFYAFDLPFYDGYDLTEVPLIERKSLLAALLGGSPSDGVIRFSNHLDGDGHRVFNQACRHALEGLVSKRADGRYRQRRSRDWVKSKCLKRQEFVVGGWSDPSGSRQGFGALLLGYYDDGRLIYCGRVGTGFNSQSLDDVLEELTPLAAKQPAFEEPPSGREARGVHWVHPELVVEVEFANWTDDGILRQASFQGMREDKPAADVVRETEERPPARSRRPRQMAVARKTKMKNSASSHGSIHRAGAEVAGVRLTHPDRLLFPEQGLTKLQLAEFYESIADWILPHLADRPLTVVRCPQGRGKQCFYQKHLTDSMPDRLGGVEIEEKEGRQLYIVIDDLPGLIALVQMSVLEVHPWPARTDRIERPDRLVFDLDPGEGVKWAEIAQAARDVRERLDDVGLESFLRTSGGKGLHVVVPLVRRAGWDAAKEFSRSIAGGMTAEFPDRYIATASKARRRGKVFIDYLRNQRGATSVASYSTRARSGAPVATPLRWDELDGRMSPDKYNAGNLLQRLNSLDGDPWEGFFDVRQSLSKSVLQAAGC